MLGSHSEDAEDLSVLVCGTTMSSRQSEFFLDSFTLKMKTLQPLKMSQNKYLPIDRA